MSIAKCWCMTCGMGETVQMHVTHVEGVLEGGGWWLECIGCIATSPGHTRLSQNMCAMVALDGKKVDYVAW